MINFTPDIKFKKELKKQSGSSMNECIQCGTCSVVCTLAPEDRPFPRKEMIWAGWGLKDKLLANPDMWLCHQCGDCSSYCPRDVKPSDIISAVRQISYKQYARPYFLGVMLSKPAMLPFTVMIPVLIITFILLVAGTFNIPDGPVNYSSFFPHIWLNSSFTALTFLSYGLASIGFMKFWRDIRSGFPDVKIQTGFFKSLVEVKAQMLIHKKFGECKSQNSRKISHMLVFYGFVLLIVVTLYAIFAAVTHQYPLSFTNPFKILGNIAALMLTAGLTMMIINRLTDKKTFGKSNYSDWLLLISFMLLTISGIVVQAARFQNWSSAYHIYFFHLVCVWFVIIYLPYTKFAHMVYRILALTFANMIGRK